MSTPLLETKGLSKAFGATRALDNVSLCVLRGEVHAVVGENGAGKSTLINVISGVIAPDRGEIRFSGEIVTFDGPQAAQKLGISTVHQELSLAELLTVSENIFAARLPSRFGLIEWKVLQEKTDTILRSLNISLDPGARVSDLPISSRQIVEIAKALSLDAKLFLFDEPTSALDSVEKEALFRVIRRLRAGGIGIIYISHHLNEVMSLADRISVLRDGCMVATHETTSVTPEQLVTEMVGRLISSDSSREARKPGLPILQTRGLTHADAFFDISLTIHAGEIIGLAGLMGSGRSILAACLVGIFPTVSGEVLVNGRAVKLLTLRQAMDIGIGYLPSDRKSEGLFLGLSLSENIVVASLRKYSVRGLFDVKKQRRAARGYIKMLNINARDSAQQCDALSGGNQQKVLLARWLETAPQLLILQEPTKGVDIAAKREIHRQLEKLAATGSAILFVSSELPELLSLSHRILVMHQGRIAADLAPEQTNEEEITAFASGLRGMAA
jgi:ABC-type sugar transport system ATPase subunit